MLLFSRSVVRFITAPAKSVAGAALILAIFAILSRLLGLFRDRMLASRFGAGDTLDVYYASFRVPDFLYSLLVLGALSAAFIPVFTEVYEKESAKKAWKLAVDVLFLIGISMAGVSLLCVFFMPLIAPLIAPGFFGEKKVLFIELSRIMFLSPFFLGISAVFGGVLVAKRCFFAYSLAPLLYNVGIILGVLFLVPFFGISGLAWGVVFGAGMHCVVQFIAAKREGMDFSLPKVVFWRDRKLLKILRLMMPQTLAMATNQLNLFVTTIFASFMVAGSLAVYNFANNLQSIPLGLFGISFGVAVFPKLSTLAARKEFSEFSQTVQKTALRILYFVIPISIMLILLRAQIVRVVLGSGYFDWSNTEMTFQVLALLSVSLFAQSLLPLLVRSFYSIQDTTTPLVVSLMSQIMNISLVLFLYKPFGIYGLAASFSISSIFNSLLLISFLYKKINHFDGVLMLRTVGKIVLATVYAGIATQISKMVFGTFLNLDTFIEVLSQLSFSLAFGISVYLVITYLLRVDEFFDFRKQIYIRMFQRSQKTVVPEEDDMERM